MLLSIVLAAVNFWLNWISVKIGRIAGLDITPFAIMLIVWHGDNMFLGTGLVLLSYCLVELHRFSYLPSILPTVLILSLLALVIHNGYILLILYHVMGIAIAYALGFISPRYMEFVVVHLILNFLLLRSYYAFF